MRGLSLLVFSSLGSSRLRAAITAMAVALGVAAALASVTAVAAIRAGLERTAQRAAGAADLEARVSGETGMDLAAVERVAALPEVLLVAPLLEKRTFLRPAGETEQPRGFVQLVGLDPAGEETLHGLTLRAGRWPAPGERAVALLERWAGVADLGVGSRVEMVTRDGFEEVAVVGLAADTGSGREGFGRVAYVSLRTAQEAFGMAERVTGLAVRLRPGADRAAATRAVEAALPARARVADTRDLQGGLQATADSLAAGLAAFGVTALAVGMFLVQNTIEMTVAQQRREIGLLRAAGFERVQVLQLVLAQSLVVGTVGSVLGAALGIGLGWLLVGRLAGPDGPPLADAALAPLVALAFLSGVVASLLSSLFPAWRASAIAPVEAVRTPPFEDWPAQRISRGLVSLALALLAGAALLAPLPERALAPARLVGALLWLAAAALIPFTLLGPLSALCAAPFRWIFRAEGRLAALNLVRGQRRVGLTVIGFTVSVTLLVALVGLGETAATAGQERAAALFPGGALVVAPVAQPDHLAEPFARAPGVARASGLRSLTVEWAGTTLEAMAVDPAHFAASPTSLPLVAGSRVEALERMRQGRAILLPRRLAQEQRFSVGASFPLRAADGGTVEMTVVGVLASSFPTADGQGALLISREDATRYFGATGFTLLALSGGPGVDEAALAADLEPLAERYGMEAVSVRTLRRAIAEEVGGLLLLLGSLVALGLVVAVLGIVNTMLMNVAEYRREIGVLRALGLTRGQVQVMVMAEAGMIGLMGGLIGAASGLALTLLLAEALRSVDFDPRPVLPLGQAAGTVAATVVLAMLAALPPAHAAASVNASRVLLSR